MSAGASHFTKNIHFALLLCVACSLPFSPSHVQINSFFILLLAVCWPFVFFFNKKDQFIKEFKEAVVRNSTHFYAIPHEGSKTAPEVYERVLDSFSLPHKKIQPSWINFDFIRACYRVDEKIYDPVRLKTVLECRLRKAKIDFRRQRFTDRQKSGYGAVVYATYGLSGGRARLFDRVQLQVAEKILIRLPPALHHRSLVVVDGPFTAFDPYGSSPFSLFGSAEHTNHWKAFDPAEPIPSRYKRLLNRPRFTPVRFTHFEQMRADCQKSVPEAAKAQYLGSRFTLRLIEYNPEKDRRILKIKQSGNEFSVFSGKVVSAVKAARDICARIEAL